MSARDELARELYVAYNAQNDPEAEHYWEADKPTAKAFFVMADAILAAGYSKPRTITTAEELDALTQRATVLDGNGHVWTNDGDTLDQWGSVSDPEAYGGPKWLGSADLALPATVLHEPKSA